MSKAVLFDFVEFEKTWRSNLKEPDKLFLSYLLINVTELVINSTKKDRGYDPELIDMIKYFVEYLRDDEFILTKIIAKVDHSVIKDLVTLVDQNHIEQKKINPLIYRVDSILRNENFVKATKTMFLKNEIKAEEYHLVIGNLLRTLLTRHSISALNDLPSNLIKDYLVREKFRKVDLDVFEDKTTGSSIQNFLNKLENIVNEEFAIIKNSKDYHEYISNNLLCKFSWIMICESIYELIFSQINYRNGLSNMNEKSTKDLIKKIIKKIFYVLVSSVLENRKSFVLQEFFIDEYIENLSNKIKNFTQINKTQINISLLDGILPSLLECMWDDMCSILDKSIDSEYELFVNFYSSRIIEKTDFAKFPFYVSFMNYLERLLNRIFDLIMEKVPIQLDNKPNFKFTTYLRDKIVCHLSCYGNYKELIRSSSLSPDLFITNLFNRLLEQEKLMEVFFEIGNLDLKNDRKEIKSNIIIYDPRKWYLGESFKMDWLSNVEKDIDGNLFSSEYRTYHFIKSRSNTNAGNYLKRNSCRIKVTVNAMDPERALEKGLKEVFNSVSMISFLLAKSNTNFKPQILNLCFVRSLATNEGYYYPQIVSHKSIDKFEFQPEHWKILSNIVTYMNGSNLNYEIQESIALFRMGYSNPNVYLKFSTYWTALEQLIKPFTQNHKDIEVISQLSITWRDSKDNLFLNSHLKSIIDKIKKNMEVSSKLNTTLKGWDVFDFVLLENLHKIKTMTIDNQIIESIDNYHKWLYKIDKNEENAHLGITNKESIVNEIIVKKVIQKFKVYIVDSKRNQIFHEGYKPIDGLNHITNFLEELLFKIIIKFLEMQSLQRYHKLDGIVRQLNRPFKDPAFTLPIKFSNIIFDTLPESGIE